MPAPIHPLLHIVTDQSTTTIHRVQTASCQDLGRSMDNLSFVPARTMRKGHTNYCKQYLSIYSFEARMTQLHTWVTKEKAGGILRMAPSGDIANRTCTIGTRKKNNSSHALIFCTTKVDSAEEKECTILQLFAEGQNMWIQTSLQSCAPSAVLSFTHLVSLFPPGEKVIAEQLKLVVAHLIVRHQQTLHLHGRVQPEPARSRKGGEEEY